MTDGPVGRWAMTGRVVEITDGPQGLRLHALGVPAAYAPRLEPDGTGWVVRGRPYDGLILVPDGDALLLGGALRLVRDASATGPAAVRLPPPAPDPETVAGFEAVLAGVRDAGGAAVALPPGFALGDWLAWLTDRDEFLFHGSQDGSLGTLEPRRTSWELQDEGGRGNLAAVYATDDALWSLWFAVIDRAALRGSMRSAVEDFTAPDGALTRFRFFSLDHRVLPRRPFTDGWLYVLPRDGFRSLPIMPGGPPSHEWGNPSAVVPLARLRVAAAQVPYLEQVSTHDDGDLMVFEEASDRLRDAQLGAAPTGTGVVLHLASSPELLAALPVWARLGEQFLPGVSRCWEEHADGSVSAYLEAPDELGAMLRNVFLE
jgi:hypothetical protein